MNPSLLNIYLYIDIAVPRNKKYDIMLLLCEGIGIVEITYNIICLFDHLDSNVKDFPVINILTKLHFQTHFAPFPFV